MYYDETEESNRQERKIGSDDAPESREMSLATDETTVSAMRRRKREINQFQKWLVYSNTGRERKRIRDKDLSGFGKSPIISVSLTFRRHRYGRTSSDVDTDKNWRLRSNLLANA